MKLCFLLVLLHAGATLGTIEKRIMNGKPCAGNQRLYHVSITSKQQKTKCGGSLIDKQWVITASHCAGKTVTVKVAANYKRYLLKKKEQEIKPDQQFTFKDDQGTHDIALIKLNKEVPDDFPRIELPDAGCTKPNPGEKVQIGGWGITEEGKSKTPFRIQCATTIIGECGENDKPGFGYYSDESILLCGTTTGVKSCYGDSGSAVEYNHLLHGIIVSNPPEGCAHPIVMLDICKYREWIDETMKK